jgi:hypothetical protein
MALSGSQYSTEELTRTKGEMEDFLADEAKLAKTRELLKTVADDSVEAKTLKMLERTFGCYISKLYYFITSCILTMTHH